MKKKLPLKMEMRMKMMNCAPAFAGRMVDEVSDAPSKAVCM